VRGAIPVSLSVAETGTDSKGLKTLGFDGVDHIWNEVVDGLFQWVVSKGDGSAGIEASLEGLWGSGFVRPVESVNIALDDVVAKSAQC